MQGSYLGTDFNQDEIEKELKSVGANFVSLSYEKLVDKTAELLSNQKAISGFREEWSLS